MVNEKERNCKLCLRIVQKCDYIFVEDIHQEILDVLLIKLCINKCSQSVICNDCTNKLLESFAFKSICLYTEDNIAPFRDGQSNERLDISMVFCKTNNIERNITLDKKICRFCMKIIEKISFCLLKNINGSDFEMIQKYFPEMQLEAVKDPIICESCFFCFRDYFRFANNCLDAIVKSEISNDRIKSSNLEDGNNNNEHSKEQTSFPSDKNDVFAKSRKGKNVCDRKKDQRKKTYGNRANVKKKKTIIYKCGKCTFKTLWQNSFYKHSLLHKDVADVTMYKCKYCPFKTIYKHSREMHEQRHENDDFLLKKFKCEKCNFRTKSQSLLNNHKRVHEPSNKFYSCDKCSFKTKEKSSLLYHAVIHKDVPRLKCPLCTYETKHKRTLDAHKLTHNKEKTHTCAECGFQTTQKAYLALHIRRHNQTNSNKRYTCDQCSYATSQEKIIKRHKLIHQQPSETFKCEICSFESRYKTSVTRHTTLMHSNSSQITMHKCDSCSFQSKYKSQLVRHLLKHEDDENLTIYKCPTCNFKSKYKKTVRDHQLKHRDPSELEMFECYTCGLRTNKKTVLKNHMVIHMDVFYECDLCDYKTKHKRNMSNHKQVHNK